MSVTQAQLAAKSRELDAESAEVDALLNEAVATKSYGQLSELEGRVNRLAEARAELDAEALRVKAVAVHPLNQFEAASAGQQPAAVASKALTGREVSPLAIPEAALKSLHGAASSRQAFSVKAFSTLDGLLPAQLDPNVLGKIHESRILDRIPAQPISAPSYEIIVHSSTTGTPGPVAEGGQKPELVLNTTAQTVTAVKIAAHLGLGYESIQDFTNFQSYATTELVKQIEDAENDQLLNGSGTGGNMTGFLHTSGVLTHDASADAGTNVTAIDSIELAITQLRLGSALATADLLILNPATWSGIRRLKDTTGRFLFIAADSDPTRAEANSIFGIPVLVTTQIAAGSGVLLDTTKFGRVFVRESISIHTGTNNDDFTKNIVRLVAETRFVLGVERPSAVLNLSGLPTA